LIDDAPGPFEREAVDRILIRGVADRRIVRLAVPGELAGADAIGKRIEDRKAAARRAILV